MYNTTHDVYYSVGFMEDDLLMQEDAYQLIIANVNHRSSPRDAKVRDTVIGIVDEFFRVNNTTLFVDADGVVNYATLILRNDNPRFAQVVEEYTRSIQLLSQKPE